MEEGITPEPGAPSVLALDGRYHRKPCRALTHCVLTRMQAFIAAACSSFSRLSTPPIVSAHIALKLLGEELHGRAQAQRVVWLHLAEVDQPVSVDVLAVGAIACCADFHEGHGETLIRR